MNETVDDNTPRTGKPVTRSRGSVIPIFSILLIAVVVVQGWYLFDIKRQVDELDIAPTGLSAGTAEVTKDAASTDAESNAAALDRPSRPPDQSAMSAPLADPASPGPSSQKPPRAADPIPDPAPQTPPRSPFDDPFFQQGFGNSDWDPQREIERMQQEMDAFMRDAFRRHGYYGSPFDRHNDPGYQRRDHRRNNNQQGQPDDSFRAQMSSGSFDIRDLGDRYLVRLKIPGAVEQQIKVDIDEQTLTVSGEQRQTEDRKDRFGNTVFQQRMSSSFTRSVTLPGPVDPASMRTRFRDETLEIMVSKGA